MKISLRQFELFFKTSYMPLGIYAMRILGTIEESEDTVQEAFLKTWEILESGTEISNLKAYLYRTVRNEAIRRVSSKQNFSHTDEYPEITDEVIDTAERDARLWNAIDRLPTRCREVFLMSKRDGLKNSEIAEELGISIKTVENQITKAFHLLRESLSPDRGKVFFLPFL